MTPVDIDCVDATGKDPAMVDDRRRYPHALRVQTVGHMVTRILERLGAGGGIRRLRVFGHGAGGVQGLGNAAGGPWETLHYRSISLGPDLLLRYRHLLGQLTQRFIRNEPRLERLGRQLIPSGPAQTGWVELHGCRVGGSQLGVWLVTELSRLWRVRVAAGAGRQDTRPGFEGYYIVGYPDGRVETRTGVRPEPVITVSL